MKKLSFKIILVVILFILLGYSTFNIIKWEIDSKNTKDEIEEIEDIIEVEVSVDNENTQIIEQTKEIKENNPYFGFIKMNLINVDLEKLKQVNAETAGWIKVNGSNVNYPFVQGQDNSYYLTHSFKKNYNDAGWVFLDYRNNLDTDKNIIIYGHSRKDTTMFGTLRRILTNGWLNNPNNYVIMLSTENENTLWQVFSTYVIPTTSDYLQTTFSSDEEFVNFANTLINRSAHDFQVSVSESDRILTLSTCYDNDNKTVIHAKLIKKETKN